MTQGKNNTPVQLYHRDAADGLKLLVYENFHDPDFVKEAKIIRSEEEGRIYSAPETGKWWNEIQVNNNDIIISSPCL